ncbi:unnamed protein product [Acanthoscelides obtectus]|uniref:Uncharacterized protein n=1 Tax=Acanthoscelides obtectus TaxID=200917 RepID=A0A9P0JTW9_ACAOB|nr:unnamed protein product [Acanthoscelides obtectus]CAK1627966.1 hypothetical protein AOBTE_LOCUS4931 [Acanthoscelides obtectus]
MDPSLDLVVQCTISTRSEDIRPFDALLSVSSGFYYRRFGTSNNSISPVAKGSRITFELILVVVQAIWKSNSIEIFELLCKDDRVYLEGFHFTTACHLKTLR